MFECRWGPVEWNPWRTSSIGWSSGRRSMRRCSPTRSHPTSSPASAMPTRCDCWRCRDTSSGAPRLCRSRRPYTSASDRRGCAPSGSPAAMDAIGRPTCCGWRCASTARRRTGWSRSRDSPRASVASVRGSTSRLSTTACEARFTKVSSAWPDSWPRSSRSRQAAVGSYWSSASTRTGSWARSPVAY